MFEIVLTWPWILFMICFKGRSKLLCHSSFNSAVSNVSYSVKGTVSQSWRKTCKMFKLYSKFHILSLRLLFNKDTVAIRRQILLLTNDCGLHCTVLYFLQPFRDLAHCWNRIEPELFELIASSVLRASSPLLGLEASFLQNLVTSPKKLSELFSFLRQARS